MNDEQLRACERSHAELEHWHYEAIRRSPAYRLECQLDELRLKSEPSNSEMYGTLEEYPKEVLSYPEEDEYPEEAVSYKPTYKPPYIIPSKVIFAKLFNRLEQVENELTHIRKEMAELQNKKHKDNEPF